MSSKKKWAVTAVADAPMSGESKLGLPPVAFWLGDAGWVSVGPELVEKGLTFWTTKKAATDVYGRTGIDSHPAGTSVKVQQVAAWQVAMWCESEKPADGKWDDQADEPAMDVPAEDIDVVDDESANLPAEDEWDDTVHVATVVEDEPSDDVDLGQADLGELAEIARKWHTVAAGHCLDMVNACLKSGEALVVAKDLCKVEKQPFMMWVEAHTGMSQSSANKYINLAKAKAEAIRSGDTNMVAAIESAPSVRAALGAIGKPAQGSKDKKPPTWSTLCDAAQKLSEMVSKLTATSDLDNPDPLAGDVRAHLRTALDNMDEFLGSDEDDAA